MSTASEGHYTCMLVQTCSHARYVVYVVCRYHQFMW